ncbi:hypothetical protein N7510_008864 [Penicillium lagena]|uniref:uncharacterized protein n=1 Tax=Penicillium lagena TaxID=94218 RepID=UPI002541238D|nr:uncharacterized protein N7510_008864 [Penicillium lagena]KAJ5606083.1 hypothetical protein N7510_008864 [Penicillium lagena]
MEPSSARMLLLLGSGPGVGVAIASQFAQQHFDRIALFARNSQQLQKDREAVLAAAASVNRTVVVRTWQVDIGDPTRLQQALAEVEQFGTLECVYFNAARVGGSLLFQFPLESIEEDFRVSASALYMTSRWAIPLLLQKPQSHSEADWKPSLLVTSSFLPNDPIPELFALSMVKAAQANLVKSLAKTFTPQGVHVGLLVIGGVVAPDALALNPAKIAELAWKLFAQERKDWTAQVALHEDGTVDWSPSV